MIDAVFSGFDKDGDRTISLKDDDVFSNLTSPVQYRLLEECITRFGHGNCTVFSRIQFLCILLLWLGFEPDDI